MDGNGRWGKKKFNNRLLGHEKGIKNIKRTLNSSGGRVEYKSGTRGCKLAKRGKGRAYGKNS